MECNLKKFLNKTGLTNEEIEYMIKVAPGLDVVDTDKAIACTKLIIDAGFPAYEIDGLIFENPNILLYDISDLHGKLQSIEDDIEIVLKENPHII